MIGRFHDRCLHKCMMTLSVCEYAKATIISQCFLKYNIHPLFELHLFLNDFFLPFERIPMFRVTRRDLSARIRHRIRIYPSFASIPANRATRQLVEYTNEELAKSLWRNAASSQDDDDARPTTRHSCGCNKTLQCGFKSGRGEGKCRWAKEKGGSCGNAIITIPFLRERPSGEKEKLGGSVDKKRQKRSALTASTFERRNPVMQIRFSAMISLLLYFSPSPFLSRVSRCKFFSSPPAARLFLHQSGRRRTSSPIV